MYRGVGANFEKPEKIFLAYNDQDSMIRGKKRFSEKLRKKILVSPSRSRYVPPESRAPASKLVLQRGGLPSEIT